jgi:uncharacterized OB-fold protein
MITPLGNQNTTSWPGEIPIRSSYTAGKAGQSFFQALKQRGALVATACRECNQVYFPSRTFCERCFAELTQQVEIPGTGTVVSFTLCQLDRDRAPLRHPLALALVQLDGATTLFLHYLLAVREPSQIQIGAKIEVIVKTKAKRVGSILDIEGFRTVRI